VAVLFPLLARLDLVPRLAVPRVERPDAPLDVAADHAPRLGSGLLAQHLRDDPGEIVRPLRENRYGDERRQQGCGCPEEKVETLAHRFLSFAPVPIALTPLILFYSGEQAGAMTPDVDVVQIGYPPAPLLSAALERFGKGMPGAREQGLYL